MAARSKHLAIPLPGSLILISKIGRTLITWNKTNGTRPHLKSEKPTLQRREKAEKNTRKRRKPSVLDDEQLGKPTATTNLTTPFHVKSSQKRMTQHKL